MPRIDAILNRTIKKTDILRTAREVIYNKYVLYLVFLAALFDLLYSIVKEDYLYCVLFVLIGFLIAFFNKNMTVILTLTMAFATILRNILRGSGLKIEGLEGLKGKGQNEMDEDTPTNLEDENANVLTGKKSNKKETDSDDTVSSVSGKSLVDSDKEPNKESDKNKATTSPNKLMTDLKEKALDLQETQQHIIKGFEKIEPYMDKAESLIGSIQDTALTIQGMRTQQGFKTK